MEAVILSKAGILVIDDEEGICNFAKLMLERAGKFKATASSIFLAVLLKKKETQITAGRICVCNHVASRALPGNLSKKINSRLIIAAQDANNHQSRLFFLFKGLRS